MAALLNHNISQVIFPAGGFATVMRTVRMGAMKLTVKNPLSWRRSVMSPRRFSVNLTGNVSVGWFSSIILFYLILIFLSDVGGVMETQIVRQAKF